MAKRPKRLGFVYEKPKCVPRQGGCEGVAGVRGTDPGPPPPLMAAAGPDQPLYFVDGTHPAYTGHPAFGWIKRGTRRGS